jgi:hypothetical protein
MIRALTSPTLLLRLEGAALFVLGLVLYWKIGSNWLAFFLLLLTPDIGMLGYLAGTRVGAATYNLAHFALLPAIVGAAGVLTGSVVLEALSLIWFSHINMDRAVGYGLKFPDAFRHTHLDLTPPTVPTRAPVPAGK